ncbi:hypothetical protein [Inquilinus sp. CAU 1745]|uniref:hypothetical protein n=1 Tax=Inquilinus sp. CAU 1745 TaxID=3140369 RepID=UPI00325BB937
MKRFAILPIVTLLAVLVLSGCGNTTRERGLSGAGLGAAAGAATAFLTDADLLTASALGALAGAATGALTDQDTLDLGEPAWQ